MRSAHGHPHFAVSIALLYQNQVIFGVVYAPVYQDLFRGVLGKGASLNGESIGVSKVETLGASLVASGFPYEREGKMPFLLSRVSRVLLATHGFRRSGSAALDMCYVAAGRLEGYWEGFLSAWDIAAGAIILLAAVSKIDCKKTSQSWGPSRGHREGKGHS